MQRSTVNLNAPPPQFARHQALLVEARELVIEALGRLDRDVELDDVVVVVMEPELAAERGETSVSARSLNAALAKMGDPNQRADLRKVPARSSRAATSRCSRCACAPQSPSPRRSGPRALRARDARRQGGGASIRRRALGDPRVVLAR